MWPESPASPGPPALTGAACRGAHLSGRRPAPPAPGPGSADPRTGPATAPGFSACLGAGTALGWPCLVLWWPQPWREQSSCLSRLWRAVGRLQRGPEKTTLASPPIRDITKSPPLGLATGALRHETHPTSPPGGFSRASLLGQSRATLMPPLSPVSLQPPLPPGHAPLPRGPARAPAPSWPRSRRCSALGSLRLPPKPVRHGSSAASRLGSATPSLRLALPPHQPLAPHPPPCLPTEPYLPRCPSILTPSAPQFIPKALPVPSQFSLATWVYFVWCLSPDQRRVSRSRVAPLGVPFSCPGHHVAWHRCDVPHPRAPLGSAGWSGWAGVCSPLGTAVRARAGRRLSLPVSIASMACTSWTRAASCSFLARVSRSWVPVPWRVALTAGEAAIAPRSPCPRACVQPTVALLTMEA